MAAAIVRFSRSRAFMISSASMRMSVARPPTPPSGWWIMKRVLGRQKRSCFATAR